MGYMGMIDLYDRNVDIEMKIKSWAFKMKN